MLVYHGGVEEIQDPDADHNKTDNLDCGYGFYVTEDFELAEEWARSKAAECYAQAVVNTYDLSSDYGTDPCCLFLEEPDEERFNFLCNCRLRDPEYKIAEYEIIEGKVADDDGADAFAEFEQGNISKDEAIE